jgi:hypothetical protein
MEAPIYSPWQVQTIFPDLPGPTLAAWIRSGIISPRIPAGGQGFPARYNFLNLVEIGVVIALTRLGFSLHAFLAKLMQSPTQAKRPLIQYISNVHKFQCFLLLPGPPIFGEEPSVEQKAEGPPYVLRPIEGIGEFLKIRHPVGGWICVDIEFIKKQVEIRLGQL